MYLKTSQCVKSWVIYWTDQSVTSLLNFEVLKSNISSTHDGHRLTIISIFLSKGLYCSLFWDPSSSVFQARRPKVLKSVICNCFGYCKQPPGMHSIRLFNRGEVKKRYTIVLAGIIFLKIILYTCSRNRFLGKLDIFYMYMYNVPLIMYGTLN